MPTKKKKKRPASVQRKYLPLQQALKKLARMNAKTRQHALRNANDGFIRQLCTAVKSVRRKPLPSKVRANLGRHRQALRAIADPQLSLKSKRRVISRQKGGFFSLIPKALKGLTYIIKQNRHFGLQNKD